MEALQRHRTGMPIPRLNSPVISFDFTQEKTALVNAEKTPQVVSDGQARYRDQSDVRMFERKLGGTAEEFLRP